MQNNDNIKRTQVRFYKLKRGVRMILGINPYLVLDGSGQEAVQFYKEALDAKVEVMQTFGDMPENPEYPIPAEAKRARFTRYFKSW